MQSNNQQSTHYVKACLLQCCSKTAAMFIAVPFTLLIKGRGAGFTRIITRKNEVYITVTGEGNMRT